MLNTTYTPPPPPPVLTLTPPLKRKRGGQPGNNNARIHGIYAVKNPHPLAPLLVHARHITEQARENPETIPEKINALRHIALQIANLMGSLTNITSTKIILLRQLLSLLAEIRDLALLQHNLGAEMRSLNHLAKESSFLITREFEQKGIATHPVFVPLGFENLSALSTFCGGINPSGAFLTDRHWFIIEPILTSYREELIEQAELLGRRHPRRSLHLDRFILDGILWKLTTACRWDELPAEYPLRHCQRLYRDLYETGRMAAIYEILHQDLHIYGNTSLETLVEGGEYSFHTNKVIYIPVEQPDWQHTTALLLLQRAFFNYRKLKRENQAQRRRRGLTFRLPPLPYLRNTPRAYHKRTPPPLPPDTFTVPSAQYHPLFHPHPSKTQRSINHSRWHSPLFRSSKKANKAPSLPIL